MVEGEGEEVLGIVGGLVVIMMCGGWYMLSDVGEL